MEAVLDVKNGKTKTIWILAGWLFIVCCSVSGTAFALTWKAVAENRKNITDVERYIGNKLDDIIKKVARIEALIEK